MEIFLIIVIAIVIVVVYLFVNSKKENGNRTSLTSEIDEMKRFYENEIEKLRFELKYSAPNNQPISTVTQEVIDSMADKEAKRLLEIWKKKEEDTIRNDAHVRSRAQLMVPVNAQTMPLLDKFPGQWHEARFIGSPVTYIVFKNIDDPSKDLDFVEIIEKNVLKSARVNKAIENKKVIFYPVHKK